MKQFAVLSVCNALVDLVYEATNEDLQRHGLTKGQMHLVDRAVQNALLTQFSGHQQTVELGGSSLNAIRALALLDHKTAFVGMVAHDPFGQQIEQRLAELNIKGHLYHNRQAATGTCMVFVTPDHERTMVTHLGASCLYSEEHIPLPEVAATKVFHFCGYQWDSPNQKKAITKAVAHAKQAGGLVSFDMADPFVVQKYRGEFITMFESADVVFANKEEARLLFGLSPEQTAEKIAAGGAIAVVKLGAEGALIQRGDQVVRVQPVATKVVDTTAAGDMFAAGFLHGFVSGRPLDECGRIAAMLASDVISRYGATLSSQVIADVKRLFR